eukprot:jgi/Chlat1/7597/Chrsp64S07152
MLAPACPPPRRALLPIGIKAWNKLKQPHCLWEAVTLARWLAPSSSASARDGDAGAAAAETLVCYPVACRRTHQHRFNEIGSPKFSKIWPLTNGRAINICVTEIIIHQGTCELGEELPTTGV